MIGSQIAGKGKSLIIQLASTFVSLPYFLGVSVLLVGILIEFVFIMDMNHGFFVYTIDDPYIHLALAENIQEGHYGINPNEFSAPSSSILWPFLLAPFSAFELFPFILNVLLTVVILYLYYKILDISFKINNPVNRTIIISTLLVMLTCGTNLIGLIFTGMEHTLQVMVVVAIAWGLICLIEKDYVKPWLLGAIVTAPLIRYENACISLVALGYLYLQKYYKKVFFSLAIMVLFLASYSIFLTSLGLSPLPTSILAKLEIVPGNSVMVLLLKNLNFSLMVPQGRFLVVGFSCLIGYFFLSKSNRNKKQLAVVTASAILLHLIAGKYGWFHRYEIYIWAFVLLVGVYLGGGEISRRLAINNKLSYTIKLTAVIGILMFLTSQSYISVLIAIPTSSNNIYEQHYQLHRFAVDYYRKPVAVHDLGYVSYKNKNYVLELWGLLSIDVFEHKVNDHNSDWMSDLVKLHDVELAMIYEHEYQTLPESWIKLGELHVSRSSISPLYSYVSFYAISEAAISEIMPKLEAFTDTLPDGVKFDYE